MKILFTGNYLIDYNRTKILADGLKKLGHTIIDFPFTKKSKANQEKIKDLSKTVDFVFLPCFTHTEVKFVKSYCGQTPLVFDPLISRYLTKVFDYKLVSRWGISALRNFYRDKTPMQLADLVLTDTIEHKKYFNKTFGVPLEKMEVLYIGNNFSDYDYSETVKNKKFKVGFYGGFIPLQGVLTILEAISILKGEDIDFELIGNGFEYEKALKYIKKHNLDFVSLPGWLNQKDLADRINTFDVALGIFGQGEKTSLVIPNKIYHYASSKLAIITKSTPAISEVFIDKDDIYLVDGSAKSIAQAILDLKSNTVLKDTLAKNAYEKMKNNFTEIHVAKSFLLSVEKIL